MFPLPVRPFVAPAAQKFSSVFVPRDLAHSFDRACREADSSSFPGHLLRNLHIQCDVDPAELSRIPATGPAIVVSNHPFGILDGIGLAGILQRVRADYRILTNSLAAPATPLEPNLIPLDIMGSPGSQRKNATGLRSAIDHLQNGGLLAVFPAGEVSHLQLHERRIADGEWNPAVVRLALRAGCPVIPVFFAGNNSAWFQIVGGLNANFRTASLVRELHNKRGSRVHIRIGRAVPSTRLAQMETPEEAAGYLRYRSYLLGLATRPAPIRAAAPLPPVIAPCPTSLMASEVTALQPIVEQGDLAVYCAEPTRIPAILEEIGRLRELSFRAAGEGTGQSQDLDGFDRIYRHLFIWDRAAQKVVGAYRLGLTTEILPKYGVSGLYTHSLFRLDPRFLEALGPALELGRSFVRPEYQKQYAPLMLLWKGIFLFLASQPGHVKMFGAVSISSAYSLLARRMMVALLETHRDTALSAFVKPRRPFSVMFEGGSHGRAVQRWIHDTDHLSDLVKDLEHNGKGVPVLIRQYLKMGGKVLGFNVDPSFQWVVDALITVDLQRAPQRVLDRYVGADLAARLSR